MNLRGPVLVLAALGIPVALLLLVLPITWGYGGYRGDGRTVQYIDPQGPAYRAGLRSGDRLATITRGWDAINEMSGPAGTQDTLYVVRPGGVRVIRVTFEPFSGAQWAQQQLGKVLNALTALGAFIVTLLVLLRGRNSDLSLRAAYVLVLGGAWALSQSLALVVYYALPAWLLTGPLPPILFALTMAAALNLLATYPTAGTKFRRILARIGLAVVPLATALVTYVSVLGITGHAGHGFFAQILLGYSLVVSVSVVHAMASARANEVIPMRWLGAMWLIAYAAAGTLGALRLALVGIAFSHYADAVDVIFVAFLTFGVAYPILRHRMIDMNIWVSRATVFTVVSLILVSMFVGAEWAIGKIFEHSLGFSNDRGGLAAQIVTLVVVLVLGISARSIHGFVEDRLSKIFFRKRLEALRDLERVAHETDAATDASAVLTIAVDTVQQCFEPSGVALYLLEGERYTCERERGALALPEMYDFNDPVPLRLRRWQQPFENKIDGASEQHALFLPMTLRGEVLGFLVCGPKPDHSAYLPDEISALSLLAHHTGIASAWLSRPTALPSLDLSATRMARP